MAVRLSALCSGHALPPEKSSDTHFCLRLSPPQDHSAAEGLGKLKHYMTSSGLENTTFRLGDKNINGGELECLGRI
jgi:hypothetical protein